MKRRSVKYFVIQFIMIYVSIYAQNYKVEYIKLSSPLFEGDSPIICILEEDNKLFAALGQNPDFTNKFTCYSSEVIAGLKDALQVEVFNPEDQKFQQALKEQLSVGYILNWKTVPDSNEVFILDIYSTESSNRIYNKRFYSSTNSNPYEDIRKLLVENMEPFYILPGGQIEVTSVPETAHFKLIRGDELIKEWTGSEILGVRAGKYRLISEAEKYVAEESEVEIFEGQTTTVNINLKPSYSSFISVRSIDGKVSNIKTDINEEQVKITYNLVSKNKADIALVLVDKQSGIIRTLKMAAGDIVGVEPGNNKVIFWEMLKELGSVPLNEAEIQISAKEEAGGLAGLPWYYFAGGGTALLGGAAVLLLGGGGDDGGTTPPATKIGSPPGRP